MVMAVDCRGGGWTSIGEAGAGRRRSLGEALVDEADDVGVWKPSAIRYSATSDPATAKTTAGSPR
jgi:hypothetical protein